jgi:hypothetical protein
MGPSLWARIQKAEYVVEMLRIANEEIQDSIFRGKGDANRLSGLIRAYNGWLPEKGVYYQQCKLQWFAGQQSVASNLQQTPRQEAVHKWLRDHRKPCRGGNTEACGPLDQVHRKGRRLCRKMTYLFNPYFCVKNWKNKSADNSLLSLVRSKYNIRTDHRDRIRCYKLGRVGTEYGPVEGSCEHSNEPSCSIKCWEILQ